MARSPCYMVTGGLYETCCSQKSLQLQGSFPRCGCLVSSLALSPSVASLFEVAVVALLHSVTPDRFGIAVVLIFLSAAFILFRHFCCVHSLSWFHPRCQSRVSQFV